MRILQARILEWVAIPFSKGSSWPRNWTGVSCIAGDSVPTELPGKPKYLLTVYQISWYHVDFTSVQSCSKYFWQVHGGINHVVTNLKIEQKEIFNKWFCQCIKYLRLQKNPLVLKVSSEIYVDIYISLEIWSNCLGTSVAWKNSLITPCWVLWMSILLHDDFETSPRDLCFCCPCAWIWCFLNNPYVYVRPSVEHLLT